MDKTQQMGPHTKAYQIKTCPRNWSVSNSMEQMVNKTVLKPNDVNINFL